ncbi:MAG: hypothetical protein NVSMB64_24480 [Candidatus Velthaea sp.]
MVRISRVGVALCVALMFPAAALAEKAFTGPAGWNHVVSATPGAVRTQDVWKAGDGGPSVDVLTVLTDSSIPLADAIDAVHTNVHNIGMKLTIDQDRTCNSRRAHTFEMAFGGDKKTLVNQTIIDQGAGSMRITYSRLDGQPFASEVKAALAEYCGP